MCIESHDERAVITLLFSLQPANFLHTLANGKSLGITTLSVLKK